MTVRQVLDKIKAAEDEEKAAVARFAQAAHDAFDRLKAKFQAGDDVTDDDLAEAQGIIDEAGASLTALSAGSTDADAQAPAVPPAATPS